MPSYYLYLFDRKGSISKRIDLVCNDDDHARDVAAAHSHHLGMELWQGARLVETYNRPLDSQSDS